ncbi:MAG: FMN-binding protein [Chloroflexota bacterium]|nr:FMN-binding protein [Chloroflexota bacterium]
MTTEPRPPSRLPVRGAIGLALTVGGLALLLSFRAPGAPATDVVLALTDEPEATEEFIPTATPESIVAATAPPAQAPTEAPLEPTPEPEPAVVTLVGAPVAIKWGDVQVAVTLEGDDIIDVEAIDLPGDRRSVRINDRAEPILREQAIAIDNANVDVISGATYTSRAYAMSLQSALDQLGA